MEFFFFFSLPEEGVEDFQAIPVQFHVEATGRNAHIPCIVGQNQPDSKHVLQLLVV
jgi:hypothetical protein